VPGHRQLVATMAGATFSPADQQITVDDKDQEAAPIRASR
jgi:hypothetical protein